MNFSVFWKPLAICILAFCVVAMTGPQFGIAEVRGAGFCCVTKNPDCYSSVAECTDKYTYCSWTAIQGLPNCTTGDNVCTEPDLSCTKTNMSCSS